MASILSIAEVAAMIGDPARANMLFTLKDSGAASAGDLTRSANVAPSTASEHLAKMTEAGLIAVTRSGRNRYYRLTTERVADVLEGLEKVAARTRPDGPETLRNDEATLHARGCGDHISGRLGVGLAEALIGNGTLRHGQGGLTVSDTGRIALNDLGVDVSTLESAPRKLLALCHDWSEDAFHLGGSLAGALLQNFVSRDWVRRNRGSHTVLVTPTGAAAFKKRFGIAYRVTA